MFAVPSKSPLGLALAAGVALSGCLGEVIAGVPLEDAGEELSVDDAAAATASSERDAGSAADAQAAAPVVAPSGDAKSPQGDAAARPSDPAPTANKDAGRPASGDAGRAQAGDAGRDAAMATADAATTTADASMATPRDLGSDRARFLGAPRCGQAAALLCDDFESEAAGAAPDPAVWSAPFGTLPKIDATRAARGKKSLYFELAAGAPGQIEESKTFPAASGALFGRMFVWLDALPTAPAYAHWTLASALGTGNAAEVRLSGQLDPERMNANYFAIGSDHGETGDWATAGQEEGSKVRARDWICLEWLFKSDTSETRVWVDGVEQKSLHLTSTEYGTGDQEAGKRFVHPRFDKLRIGWWLYQAAGLPTPSKLWIDEVIVDSKRIGCAL